MTSIFPLIYLTLEGIAILSAIHALFTVRTAQGTIAWIVGLVAFPIVGPAALLVFRQPAV